MPQQWKRLSLGSIQSALPPLSEAAESSPAPTVESLRESRQEDLSNFGVFYASELGAEVLPGGVPPRSLLISYYVFTSTSTVTTTATATKSVTATCKSTTSFAVCL